MGTQVLQPQPEEREATLDDLYRFEGKAELIAGRIIPLMATGHLPNRVAGNIYRSLADFADEHGGEAYTDNIAFAVPALSSGRRSFSPDASYFAGVLEGNPMRFVQGPPTFAVEVRSENDYSSAADIAMRSKRTDYFEAGTLVVWDVDPMIRLVRSYHRDRPHMPSEYRNGDSANAGDAVPEWQIAVADVFRGCPEGLSLQDL
jgi:Uma2 family endonuclease